MVRAVLDPGVLIAAFISPHGAPAQLFALWIEGAFELVTSPGLIGELREVLRREKFRHYATEEEAETFVEAIGRLALVWRDPEDTPRVSKDPDDDYLVALAASASAILVSGDAHLTDLDEPERRVMRPREFVDLVS